MVNDDKLKHLQGFWIPAHRFFKSRYDATAKCAYLVSTDQIPLLFAIDFRLVLCHHNVVRMSYALTTDYTVTSWRIVDPFQMTGSRDSAVFRIRIRILYFVNLFTCSPN